MFKNHTAKFTDQNWKKYKYVFNLGATRIATKRQGELLQKRAHFCDRHIQYFQNEAERGGVKQKTRVLWTT